MIMIYDFYRLRPFFGPAFPCGFVPCVGVIFGISDSRTQTRADDPDALLCLYNIVYYTYVYICIEYGTAYNTYTPTHIHRHYTRTVTNPCPFVNSSVWFSSVHAIHAYASILMWFTRLMFYAKVSRRQSRNTYTQSHTTHAEFYDLCFVYDCVFRVFVCVVLWFTIRKRPKTKWDVDVVGSDLFGIKFPNCFFPRFLTISQ